MKKINISLLIQKLRTGSNKQLGKNSKSEIVARLFGRLSAVVRAIIQFETFRR